MKKRNIMKTLFAGTMTLGMALSISPAFAAETQAGTPTDPAELWLVKELNIAPGITKGEQSFTFDFEQTLFNDSTENLNTHLASNLDQELTVSSTNKISSVNVLANATFPSAGKYTFTVTEDEQNDLTDDGYGLTVSEAEYTVDVYVKNSDNGLYAYNVIVNKIKDDKGSTDTEEIGKVDPNPDGNKNNSKFKFVNTYTKNAVSENDPDGKALVIEKLVTGDFGDKTKDFTFEITLDLPNTDSNTNGYTGTINDSNITFKDNEKQTVSFKHGSKLEFDSLPAGTTYTIVEKGEENYTASAQIVSNGDSRNKNDGSASTDFSVENILVGADGDNKTTITNNYANDGYVNPTGIIINNLPFVLMVVVAGSGLALYVVSKRRSHQ